MLVHHSCRSPVSIISRDDNGSLAEPFGQWRGGLLGTARIADIDCVEPSGSSRLAKHAGEALCSLLALRRQRRIVNGPELPFTEWRLPGLRSPHRGDIIVFKYPQDEKRDFIKRIVATPGDQVQIRGHDVYVNGHRLVEPYVKPGPPPFAHSGQAYCGYAYGCEMTRVPADSYFVMGDNRDNSQDSRYWGFVKREKIKGKAFLIYWSWDSDRHWLRWWRLGKYIP